GRVVGLAVQSGADLTSSPALALEALTPVARTASEVTTRMVRSRVRMSRSSPESPHSATDMSPFAWATSVHRTNVHKAPRPSCRYTAGAMRIFDDLRSGLAPAVEELRESWDRSSPEPLRGRELTVEAAAAAAFVAVATGMAIVVPAERGLDLALA